MSKSDNRADKARTALTVNEILTRATQVMQNAVDLADSGRKLRRSEIVDAAREAFRLLCTLEEFADQHEGQDVENTETFAGHMYERIEEVLDFFSNRFTDIGALSDFDEVIAANE